MRIIFRLFCFDRFSQTTREGTEVFKRAKCGLDNLYKTGKDQPFIEALSDEWSGALPYTKILNKDGEVVAGWEQGAEY